MNLELDRSDTLTDELDALITIGRTLAHLPDPAARLRVLRWAIERFRPEMTSAHTAVPATDRRDDPALAVGSLADLFGDTRPIEPEPEAAPIPHEESQVRRLVRDVQRMVHWQRA